MFYCVFSENTHQQFELLRGECQYISMVTLVMFYCIFSENARQQFELLRGERRHAAAVTVQCHWRRYVCVKHWPVIRRQLDLHKRNNIHRKHSK